MSNRRRARRPALQALCCLDVQGSTALEPLEAFLQDSRESPADIAEASHLMRDTWAEREELDRVLARHARHWELGRLALVDRNILRMAVHELRHGPTPPKVVISEALRLAQEFSTVESPRFINGVLDAVARELGKVGQASQGPAGQDPSSTDTCTSTEETQ